MDELDEQLTGEEREHVGEATRDVRERFIRLMPAGDLTLIVLKGHLLVEEQMNKFIQSSLGEAAAAFDSLRLPFGRKWKFAKQLLAPRDFLLKIWGSVNDLNDLRNAIAHNPEVDDLPQRCAKFVERVEGSDEIPAASMDVTQESRLVGAIGSIVASLAGIGIGRQIALKRQAGRN